MKLQRMNGKLIAALVAVILLTAAVAGYFGWQYFQLKNSPKVENETTTKRIIQAVGKIYALPSDEQPTVAEIKDKSKLGDQKFFERAKNGDYLLLFGEAKMALIYRESIHKLINVGPIDTQNQQTQAKPPTNGEESNR